MKKERPVNLNLFTIRFPVPAISSILHRISGVLLFLFIPFVLYVLEYSLASAAKFQNLQPVFDNRFFKFIVWMFLASLIYHFIAGVRHLLMDIGFGENLKCARASAYTAIILSAIVMVLVGVWLW